MAYGDEYGDDYTGPDNSYDPGFDPEEGWYYDPAQGMYVPAPSVVGAPTGYLAPEDTNTNDPPPPDPAPEDAPSVEDGGGGGGTAAPAPAPVVAPPPTITPPVINGPNPVVSNVPSQGDELFSYLMEKAKQSVDADPNDPRIRAQADNYAANLTRQGRRYLSELAERKGPGGNIGAESRMMSEKNAQAAAAREGDLLQHESGQRRAEIMQALQLGSQFMTSQQQLALQKELAEIDNKMKLYQTDIQNQQFGRSLDQNESQFSRNLGQSAAQFGSSMGQRASEFNRNLSQRAYEYDTDDDYRWMGL